MPQQKTTEFELEPSKQIDFRFLVNAKQEVEIEQRPYVQVFSNRHGFVENTSILDLLFNEGTNALNYLRKQNIDHLDA